MTKAWEGHTPGPWKVLKDGNRLAVEMEDTGEFVCHISPWNPHIDAADAALIAAAPDLAARVETLEAALKEIAELPDVDADHRSTIARAALRGEP